MGRHIRKMISRYVNCSMKGAISLFMAVLMTPFLTIAMVLVDTGRYNSAVSILDEAMGVSSVSTLAHYDSYLHDRWGLMSISQGIDMNRTYSQYLNENVGIMGKSLKLNQVTAEGEYALAENELLYNQILEYCKLNAPTKLATNFLNISNLIKELEKFKNIGKIFSAITSGTDAIDSTITLLESAEDVKETADKLQDLEKKYNEGYSNFSSAVDALIAALNVPEPEKSEYTDDKGNFDSDAYEAAVKEREEDIESARTGVVTARDAYAETLDEITECVQTYKEKMGACASAVGDIGTNLASLGATAMSLEKKANEDKKTLEALQKEISAAEKDADFNPEGNAYINMKAREQTLSESVSQNFTKSNLASASAKGLKAVNNSYQDTFSSYSDATFGEYITGFQALKSTVSSYSEGDVKEDSSSLDEDTYHNVHMAGYVTSADIDAYLERQKEELLSGSLKAVLDGLISFYNSLIKLSLFYDPELSAVIDMNFYNTNLNGLPGAGADNGGVMAVVTDVGNIVSAIKSFSNNLENLKLISALKSLKNLITSIVNLLTDLAQFAVDICKNISELFSSYDRLYYSTYATFNLSCRTDNTSGSLSFSAMTGYSLDGTSLPDQGIFGSGLSAFDDLAAAIDAIRSYENGSGDDLTFSGAELEYILYGSKTEISNQIYTFFALYMLRLLLDVIPITANTEVQSLAAASTFGYPVVMTIEILAEPLVDTILLVNGSEVPLIETTIYLTPSGLPDLLEGLQSIVKFTSDDKESLKSSLVGAFRSSVDDYDYQQTLNTSTGISLSKTIKGLTKFNYREYCFMLMLLTVTKEQQFARLKNLIQMETLYYYQEQGAPYMFDLRKSYTFLHTSVSADVKQMLPSLVDSSLFTAEREQYRGY